MKMKSLIKMRMLKMFIKKQCLKVHRLYQSDQLNPFTDLEKYVPSENLIRNLEQEIRNSN